MTLDAVATAWWEHEGIVRGPDGRLRIAGHDAEAVAREHGTPLIAYDPARVADTTTRFRDALARTGVPYRLRFAIKANREPGILAVLRGLGDVGIDACSPGEVLHALDHGWRPDEISYTGTNVSDRDLDVILPSGVHLNVDAISQVDRVGRRAPGRSIGLRVNPGAGVGWTDELAYSGERPTKFGIYPERLPEAMDVARRHDLVIDTVHCHAGSGWLGDGLPAFARTMDRVAAIARSLLDAGCPLVEVNVGGGLGVPARADEPPIDLDAYAASLAEAFGPLGVTIACEPGDYLVKDCAVMLAEVITVEERSGTRFVGLDTGWNTDCGYFIYRFTKEILPVADPAAERSWRVTVAGNINEVGDVFADDYPMAPVAEGDVVALFWSGGYAQGMASSHCLREPARVVLLDRP
jgi:diaminopimelate decarboxylase